MLSREIPHKDNIKAAHLASERGAFVILNVRPNKDCASGFGLGSGSLWTCGRTKIVRDGCRSPHHERVARTTWRHHDLPCLHIVSHHGPPSARADWKQVMDIELASHVDLLVLDGEGARLLLLEGFAEEQLTDVGSSQLSAVGRHNRALLSSPCPCALI